MTDFRTGDRVVVVVGVPAQGGPSLPEGATGTVGLKIAGGIYEPMIEVDWDEPYQTLSKGGWLRTRFALLDSESLSESGGATTPPTASETESGDSRKPEGRVYVSGPMTGLPEFNFPAFDAEADRLRALGWDVENPADKGIIDGWGWEEYLRYDMRVLSDCTAIFTLPNWHESPGANLEMIVAMALGVEWLNPDGHEPSLGSLAERVPALASLVGVPATLDTTTDATIENAGEVRLTSSTGGEKGVKPERYDLLPYDALNEVARVYGFGASKYADHNWRKGYPWGSSIAAAFRHMAAFAMGEDRDPESGLLHPAHAIFHMLSAIAWHGDPEQYAQHDDRYILT